MNWIVFLVLVGLCAANLHMVVKEYEDSCYVSAVVGAFVSGICFTGAFSALLSMLFGG